VFKPEKAKTVLESWKMLNNEKEVQNGDQVTEVTISTRLYSIAKNENVSKTAVTFLVFDTMFVNSYCTT